MMPNTVETSPSPAVAQPPLVLPSLGELLENWYEGSAYGDHVPKELPELIVAFIKEHSMRVITEESAWEIISESTRDDSWLKLFECIFAEGAKYATMAIEDRGLLRENSVISKPVGISSPENPPVP